jgi:hypothetical protein
MGLNGTLMGCNIDIGMLRIVIEYWFIPSGCG